MKKNLTLILLALLSGNLILAQSTLISNITQPLHNYHGTDDLTWCAEAFTTDANPYNLYSVSLYISSGDANASLKIYSDNAGNVGTLLGSFGSATLVSGSIYSFTPSATILLDASTNYWLVMQSNSSGTSYWVTNNSSTTTGPGSLPVPPANLTAQTFDAGITWDYYPRDPDFPPFLFEVLVTPYNPNPLTATASVVSHAGCTGQSNGSVTVSVSGGSSPYNYTWSTNPVQSTQTATGLAAGTYFVTVTDDVSSHAYSSATVTANPLPAPVISGVSTVTQGQTATYTTPLVAGHTYSWNCSHGNAYPCMPDMNCLTLTWDFPCGIVNPGWVKVTETITATGCSTTTTLWVTVSP